MSVQSDTYAATNTNQTYDFLDSAFWAGNPTNAEIIAALYGTNSAYTNGWSSNPCNTANMQVDYFTTLPTTLSSNKIYVLQT